VAADDCRGSATSPSAATSRLCRAPQNLIVTDEVAELLDPICRAD
jgi:hypothetical protein